MFSFHVACIQNLQVCVNFFREVFKYIFCNVHCFKIKYATWSDTFATFTILVHGNALRIRHVIVAYHDY